MIRLSFKKNVDYWLGGPLLLIIYPFVRLASHILRRKHDLSSPKHIVFIKMLGGGSLSMLYPTILELREKFPNLKISLICNQSITAFAKTYGFFDEIRSVNDSSVAQLFLSSFSHLIWLMRNADTSIDLEIHSRLTTVFTTLAMVKNRVGLVNMQSMWRKRLYTHAIYVNSVKNLPDVYDGILGLFNIKTANAVKSRQDFIRRNSNAELPVDVKPVLSSKPVITLGIGCSDLALERQMDVTLWAQLLQNVLDKNSDVHFLFVGGKDDHALGKNIQDKILNHQSRILNACGRASISSSIRMILESKMFIGIDSAMIHLARLIGIPSLSLWGPTSPEALLRKWPLEELVLTRSVSCSPCVHFTESPPCMGQNFCMNHRNSLVPAANSIIQFLEEGRFGQSGKLNQNSIRKVNVWGYFPDKIQPLLLEIDVHYVL